METSKGINLAVLQVHPLESMSNKCSVSLKSEWAEGVEDKRKR